MARTATQLEIRTRARRLADERTVGVFSDVELNDDINLAIAELWDELALAYGERYLENSAPSTFTTVAGTASYNLPVDFFKLSRLVVTLNGREWTIDPFADADVSNTRPVATALACSMYYVPCATKLAVDTDAFDGINGWEEFVALKVALKCKQTTEQDVSVLMAMIAEQKTRLTRIKAARDKGQARRIADVIGGRQAMTQYDWLSYGTELPRYQLMRSTVELREGFLA